MAAKKDKEKKAKAPAEGGGLRLRDHPRAQASIRRSKGWGGLAAFVLVAVLSLRAGVPAADAVLRAIGAGLAGFVGCWALAVLAWRHLAQAEIELMRRRLVAGMAALEAARERRAAERAA
jgi:hypothetical protein